MGYSIKICGKTHPACNTCKPGWLDSRKSSCLIGCQCGRHTRVPGTYIHNSGRKCPLGCKCKRHTARVGYKPARVTVEAAIKAHTGKPLSIHTKRLQSAGRIKYLQANDGPWCDTKPERELESRLQAVGFSYEKQKRIGGMLVDFYLPQHNLVIEVDGCYWHSCPSCMPDGGVRPDGFKARQQQLSALGYDAIRIWEHELKEVY